MDVDAHPLEVLGQGVGLPPEGGAVDVVFFEDWILHVARDQGLVEIPYQGDDVLGMQGAGHGLSFSNLGPGIQPFSPLGMDHDSSAPSSGPPEDCYTGP